MDEPANFRQIAVEAGASFGLRPEGLRFHGHQENLTYRVDDPEFGQGVLRIHWPASGSRDETWRKSEVIESELLWLKWLGLDTDLVVQTPVVNTRGALVSEVHVGGFPTPLRCTLLHWIDGHNLDTNPTPAEARQLGRLMARLHNHGTDWSVPTGFTRPSYDGTRLVESLRRLREAMAAGIISAKRLSSLELAVEEITPLVTSLGTDRSVWGLIHGDLHRGNYLIFQKQIRPIDFSLCGFGHFLYDVGHAMMFIRAEERPSFLAGYRDVRTLPDDPHKTLEYFFIVGLIHNLALLAFNPVDQEVMRTEARELPDKVDAQVRNLLDGRRFLY